jgi:hypothetical protein
MALNLSAQNRLSIETMVATDPSDPTKMYHGDIADLKALVDQYDRGELTEEQLEAALEEGLKTATNMCHTMHLNLLGR